MQVNEPYGLSFMGKTCGKVTHLSRVKFRLIGHVDLFLPVHFLLKTNVRKFNGKQTKLRCRQYSGA